MPRIFPFHATSLQWVEQIGLADQVVGHHGQPNNHSDQCSTSGTELPQNGGLIDPAEHFHSPLTGVDRMAVARLTHGTAFNRWAPAVLNILSRMWCDLCVRRFPMTSIK